MSMFGYAWIPTKMAQNQPPWHGSKRASPRLPGVPRGPTQPCHPRTYSRSSQLGSEIYSSAILAMIFRASVFFFSLISLEMKPYKQKPSLGSAWWGLNQHNEMTPGKCFFFLIFHLFDWHYWRYLYNRSC